MAERKPRGVLIAGNWKMNNSQRETAEFFAELKTRAQELSKEAYAALRGGKLQLCVCPPFLSLAGALEGARHFPFPIAIAAQNVHWEKKGAFTGEISGPMASEIGVSWALVGHSERRQFFGETDETARKRTESLLEQGFRVILCIGETRAERESSQTNAVLERQLAGALPAPGQGAAKYLDGRLIIAYEPVWAIGTGLTATPQQAEEAHQVVRKLLWDRFGIEAAGRTQILYGGSVTPQNADQLLACPNVDGALVGGASVKAESFMQLVVAGAKSLG